MSKHNRGTIFLEDAVVLSQMAFDGDQRVVRNAGRLGLSMAVGVRVLVSFFPMGSTGIRFSA